MKKSIRWLSHARKALKSREIDEAEVIKTILKPELTQSGRSNRIIRMRFYIDAILEQRMLLRVVTEETKDEIVVITIYKTSRSSRYLGDK